MCCVVSAGVHSMSQISPYEPSAASARMTYGSSMGIGCSIIGGDQFHQLWDLNVLFPGNRNLWRESQDQLCFCFKPSGSSGRGSSIWWFRLPSPLVAWTGGGFQICRCLKTCFQATESKRELISLNFGSFNNFRAASQTPYESFKSGAFPMNMVIYSYILIQHTPNNLETIQKWTQGELGHHHSDRSRADGWDGLLAQAPGCCTSAIHLLKNGGV